jgi:hypothetical protein
VHTPTDRLSAVDGRGRAAVAPAWQRFADAVLHREALRCRVGEGRQPRDAAGLYVDHADVERILGQLPGLDGPPDTALRPIDDAVGPVIERTRAELHRGLADGSTGAAPRAHVQARPRDDAFARAVHGARLGREAAEVLALVASVELDRRRQQLLVYIQDSIELPRVTLSALPRLFADGGGWLQAVAPSGRLLISGFVDVESGGPWAARTIGVAPRLTWALAGADDADPALPADAQVVEVDASATGTFRHSGLLLVAGGDRVSRHRTATMAAGGGRFLVASDPIDEPGWTALVREASVTGAGIVVDVERDLAPHARQLIDAADHLSWAVCSERELPLRSLPQRPWQELRAEDRSASPPDSISVRLDASQRELVARAAAGMQAGHAGAVRRLASGELDRLAVRVRPRRGWGDLVLPSDQTAQLRELVARERRRGTVYGPWGFAPLPSAGTVAVFAGPSGTGKTLAAEIVAGDLDLDVYKVDLSAVVSKYIGETEKNLERIFGAAGAGHVVLFFDEADALFGKRSEVGDAHDRYANLEVAYLLQRLETYDGLVVLATNLQRNMDTAFLRRIHVAVEFPLPEAAEREAMWRQAFPAACPTEDLDLDFLAHRFELSGGSIRNAALGAAFLAADRGAPVSMDVVVLALKREFQKLGRLRTEEDFGHYFELVTT